MDSRLQRWRRHVDRYWPHLPELVLAGEDDGDDGGDDGDDEDRYEGGVMKPIKFVIGGYGPGAPAPEHFAFVSQVRLDGTLTNPVFEGPLEDCREYVRRHGVTNTDDHELVFEVVQIAGRYDFYDKLLIRTAEDRLVVFVDCSDVFEWGSADCEPVETLDDATALREAFRDAATAALPSLHGLEYGVELYCARRRGCHPQGAAYPKAPAELMALFDLAGPPRNVGLGNPHPRPLMPS